MTLHELDQVYFPLVNRFTFYGWGGGRGTNTLSAYRGERLVHTVEYMLCTDDVSQAMTVEIGQQGRLGMDQHQPDAVARQVVLECSHHACCRVIDVRDRAGIHHQPAHRRGRLFDETAHVCRKTASVGIEEGRAELEDYQAGPAQRPGDGRCRLPLPGAGLYQHCRVRTVAVAYMAEQGERHGQQDTLLDANDHYDRGGGQRELELAGAFAPDVAQAGQIDEPYGDREDDGAKHALRQILQRAGQKEEYERDDGGGGEVRELAAPARALDHSSLRRTTIDHERAAERRGRIGRRQSEEVGVFVECLAMARRVGARRRGALGDNHHKARGRHREQLQGLLPAHLRHTEARQASGHRPNDGDAM